jgi:5'-nucleotidase
MLALVTNDDGIDAEGLRVLAAAAVAAGLDVLVAAPHIERSGQGTALSALEAGGKLMLQERELEGLPGTRAYAVEASPAMIALMACRGALGPVPDVLLSGINHGPNTGQFILHSGTAGAAFTAINQGVPGIALSMGKQAPEHWETAAEATRRALAWFLEHRPEGAIINVNIPDIPIAEFKGLRVGRLAKQGAVQAMVAEFGEGHVTVTFKRDPPTHAPDTDAALMREGYASVTAVRSPSEATDVDVSAIATGN